MNFITFIDNAALLLMLSILTGNIQFHWSKRKLVQNLLLGLLYGIVAILAMSIPMELMPGVIFDGRSVILSLAGLFTSGTTTLIACIMAAVWRVHLGGAGVVTGVGSVIISGLAGVFYSHLIRQKGMVLNHLRLLLFGLSVHIILALWFFTLPREVALQTVQQVFLPYLVVFPLATMLIGGDMLQQRQRVEMEKDLAESEKRYRDLVRILNEGIWKTDENLITTFVNPKMAEMLGYSQQEMLGRSAYDFIPEETKDSMLQYNKRQRQGIREQHESRLVCKDGSRIAVQMGVTPVMDEQGEYRGTLTGVQDISDLKAIQAELANQSDRLEELVEERTRDLKEAQAQLIRAEKLATLGELAGSVGHELRNPLAVISNAVYLLKSSLTSNPELLEYVELVDAETQNASAIINDLLDYSRIQQTGKTPTALPELVTGLLFKLSIPKNVTVESRIQADLPRVAVNPQQVEMIFTNLITNAVDAMPDGGKLSLTSQLQDDHLTIRVVDTGVGISAENMKKIFEPLFTTKPRGIGLGLSITCRLAELNDIRIRVESQVGQGSTFSLEFLV
ncbi:MAG: two-component system, sporulation sensor kinase [Chloroflexota bacterium]|nr:two-component system, sporulation sensor kinase [Chloroflexota bacterium]